MATTTVAYGSISIVDVTDIGQLSVYPKSNLPLSVIYNPDQGSFTPNWGTNNLWLVPSIWYGSESLITVTENSGQYVGTLASGVTVTWTRQVGSEKPTALTSNETVTNGILKVNANKFTENSTLLTYIVAVSYVEPTSGQTLTAQGEISFSLVKQASTAKTVSITGESIFKYRGDGSSLGATSITLTGRVTGGAITAWQYQKNDGTWATYPNSTTNPTLVVNNTDNVFNDDTCVIKLCTADNNIYDYHTITKLKDGAAGTDTITAVLTNEDQMIPFNSNGAGDYSGAVSRIIIYESGTDVTNQWSITLPSNMSSNVTYNASATTTTNDTVTITGLTGNTGYVTFKAEKTGRAPLLKQFSVVKVQSGADGKNPIIYSLEPDTYVLNKTRDAVTPVYTPSSVTFYAYQTEDQTKSLYTHGRFKIYENVLANEITSSTQAAYTSLSDETNGYYTYTPSSSCTSIVCVLYQSGGTSTKLDTQTVTISLEGQKGEKGDEGDDGVDALNVIVGNSYDGIPTNSDNNVSTAYTVTIPFAGYQGITKVATTVVKQSNAYPTLLGISPTVTNATTSADGSIVYVIPAGTSVPTDGGTITFTFKFTQANKTVTYDYSWGKNRQARDGVDGINSVILQLSTPKGNYFENGTGNLDIEATVYDGITDVTNSSTFAWAKFNGTTYQTIDGQTSKKLTVAGSSVDGYASYRCTATYNSKPYIQYMSLIDKTDPIQVTVLSSVGDKFINGNAVGALYALVYRNGQEIDPIKSERFVESVSDLPTGAKNGDYCYLLKESDKTLVLYKYTTSWQVSSDSYIGKYEWFYRDKDGNIITEGTPSAGDTGVNDRGSKVIYVDGDLVDKKLIVDVKVTI